MKCLVFAAVLAPVVGLLIAWLGVIHVGATGGHWAVTEWFLHWTMRSSVRTAALSIEKPHRFDNANALQVAAAHFEGGCAQCHGSPGRRRSAEVLAMLPPPPDLKDAVLHWKDEELFVIVRDGLRYTGMPAWPGSGRENEVWAMVAFLREFPRMNAARYHELSGGGDAAVGTAFSSCLSCHRPSTDGSDQGIPIIAGQSESYLAQALRAYISGNRESGFMELAVTNLTNSDVAVAARHFANLPVQPSATLIPPLRDQRALSLVQTGDPIKKIAACDACHDGRNPHYPLLGGQSRSFLREQLLLFRNDRRGGSSTAHLMNRAVRNLSDDDIDRLAAHYASTPMAATLRP